MSTDKRNAPSDIPIEHAENGTVSAINGVQSGAINDKCMSEGKLTIVVVTLAILTFLGILSETSLNIAYSALMEEFAISADVVQWLTTGICCCFPWPFRRHRSWCANSRPKRCLLCHRAVFRGNARRRARIELSDAACRTTDHGARHGCFPAAADQYHSRQGSIPQARHDAWLVSLVTCAAPAIGPVFGGLVMEFLNWHWISMP